MKKYFFLIIFFVFSCVLSVNAQAYLFGTSSSNPGWYKIGTLTLAQQGMDAYFHIVGGNGYTSNLLENAQAFIHFRTSNASISTGGLYGTAYFYNVGQSKLISALRINQLSQSSWEFYAQLPAFTGYGSTLFLESVNGTWVRDFTLTASPPGVNVAEQYVMNAPATFLGSIGMGTLAPNYNLQINSAINSGYLQITSTTTGSSNLDGLIIGTGITGRAAVINRENTDLAFYTNNVEQVTLSANGNLLVGKTSQTNTSYKLDVNGNVRANKVVVNTTGADFVFEDNYRMMELDELEKYVKANRHLPGIATANDMQSSGVDVGDNQTKLLQKTEELTLYLIEQHKINKKQEEIIEMQGLLLLETREQIKKLQDELHMQKALCHKPRVS